MKPLYLIPIASLLLIAGLVSGSIAGHHHHGCSYLTDMSDRDSNQDGILTFEEYSAPEIEKHRSAFKMLDTNSDNAIDKGEWDKFLEIHGFEAPAKS